MLFNRKQMDWLLLWLRTSRVVVRARTLHHDERGTISIFSVIVLLLLTMLLGMILNVGEQIDDKIKMQNAVDAATYSSGVVMARGLNTLAFTNHLLSETIALTAYFREGRDRYAESLVGDILNAWTVVDQQLGMSEFKLIRDIQPAMAPKIELERRLVKAFGDMTAVKARLLLPPLEMILGIPEAGGTNPDPRNAPSHLIPEFQRAVVFAIPESSNLIASEIAKRNMPGKNRQKTQCVIWSQQTDSSTVVNDNNPLERLLPAVDPSSEGSDFQYLSSGEVYLYQKIARENRNRLAARYLKDWIHDEDYDESPSWRNDLTPFERNTISTGGRVSAKQSQFINLYRGFTCAKLNHLLYDQYPNTNLPHMLRQPLNRQSRAEMTWQDYYNSDGEYVGYHGHWKGGLATQQEYLDYDFTFMGAVYRPQRAAVMPGMYRVPIKGDAFSFARVMVFLPKPRYKTSSCPPYYCLTLNRFTGKTDCMLCEDSTVGWPVEWSLFSQNWAAKMIPASSESVLKLVQTNPDKLAPDVVLPKLDSMQMPDLKAINFH